MIKHILIASSLALVLSGAGCKQTATETRTDQKPTETAMSEGSHDPCSLITTDDIRTFYPDGDIKIDGSKNQKPNAVGQRICYFSIGEDMDFVQLSIIQTADMSSGMRASGQDAATLYDQEKQLVEDAEPVTGLGDAAYYGGNGLKLGAGTHVLLKDKGIKFNVNVGLGIGNDDKQRHLDIERTLAEKVIRQL